jgi:uncharacterized protein
MASLVELEAAVRRSESAVVAFSGGVDSSLVAAIAARTLGDRSLAVTAVSPALATGELDGARAVARAIGVTHEVIRTDELAREGYRRNGPDRCYHCKSELYTQLGVLAAARGFDVLLSGANTDDLGDWRPGLRAAAEHGVRHPLVEAGFGKAEVRALAHELGLPSADKPAMPCLASRLPFGTEVEPGILAQVDRAERAMKALGFRELRVRHLGETGRVELGATELARALTDDRTAVELAVLGAGYAKVEIDPEPFVSGSLTRGMRSPLPIVPV